MKPAVQSPAEETEVRAERGPASDRRHSALDDVGALPRETLAERVEETLHAFLISGRLAPGDKLSLRSVAESLSVSMMPVREAVARLASDGALEVLPGRAVRVPILSVTQFRELTRIRIAIEGYASEEAARNRSEGDLEEIERFERAFQEATSGDVPEPAMAVEANRNLHFAIYRAAGLPTLTEIIERLWLKAGPILNLDMRDEPRRLHGGRAVRAHEALVEAIRRRDGAAARAALETDIATAADHIVGIGRLKAS